MDARMNNRMFRYSLKHEDGAYVARCLDVEVASDGDSVADALANLEEALALLCDNEAWEPMLVPTHLILAADEGEYDSI